MSQPLNGDTDDAASWWLAGNGEYGELRELIVAGDARIRPSLLCLADQAGKHRRAAGGRRRGRRLRPAAAGRLAGQA
jgi:hypothetical protein